MRTDLCDVFGIDIPIFAFSHCRDVVAAVTNAGGFGVLGALAFSPEQLELELRWIDDNFGPETGRICLIRSVVVRVDWSEAFKNVLP